MMTHRAWASSWLMTTTLIACAATPSSVAPTAKEQAPSKVASAELPESELAPLPEAQRAFDAERVTGAMALFDTLSGKLSCSDRARCERGYVPASTFKIAHAIIGLETAVIEDSETVFKWDGVERWSPAWNRDNTLRSAVQVSCLPCFQQVARQVGEARMSDWLHRLRYGNEDSSGRLDFFWLGGALRISPFQQVDFLRRLDGGALPISGRTLDIVRDVFTLDVGLDHVLHGKTGFAGPPEQPSDVAWFVGWVELGDRRVFFATVIDSHPPDVDVSKLRRPLTERVLRELGALPPASTPASIR